MPFSCMSFLQVVLADAPLELAQLCFFAPRIALAEAPILRGSRSPLTEPAKPGSRRKRRSEHLRANSSGSDELASGEICLSTFGWSSSLSTRGRHGRATALEAATAAVCRELAQCAGVALARQLGRRGPSVVDALVAAFAHESGATVLTAGAAGFTELIDHFRGLHVVALGS